MLSNLPVFSKVNELVKRSPLLRRFATAALWNMLAVGMPKIVTLLAFVVVGRVMGKEVFGALGVIQSTITMIGTLAGFGLGITATLSVPRYRHSNPVKAGRILALTISLVVLVSLLMTTLLAWFSPYLAKTWLYSEELAGPLRLASLLLFLNALNGVQLASLAGLEAFKDSAKASMWSSGLSLLCIPGAFLGLEGAIASLVVSGILTCIVTNVTIRRVSAQVGVPLSFRSCWNEHNLVLRLSVPAALGGILYAPFFWFCTTLLLRTPDGYSEMGAFTAADQWRSLMMLAPGVLGQAVIPIVADCLARGQKSDAVKLLRDLASSLAWLIIPIFIAMCACSMLIMRAYGQEFGGAWLCFCILQAVVLVQVLQSPVVKFMEASGDLWLLLTFNAAHGLVMVLSAYYLVSLGAEGLASALLIAIVFHSMCLGAYAYVRMNSEGEEKDDYL
jgi:O-antigen/teichoic acid export membrane protein